MLSTLLAKGPAILRFRQHGRASADLDDLDALIAAHSEIEQRGATLAVIAEPSAQSLPGDEKPQAVPFLLLTDRRAAVARTYGLTYPTTPVGRRNKQRRSERSAPATYVIDQDHVIALAFVDFEGASQMDLGQVVQAIECLNKRSHG